MLKNILLALIGTLLGVGAFFLWPRTSIEIPEKKPVFLQGDDLSIFKNKLRESSEFDYSFMNNHLGVMEQGSIIQFKNESKSYALLKNSLGWLPSEHSVHRMKKTFDNVTIFDEIYTNGQFGFREVKSNLAKKHFIFLGGSNTYGIGVSDSKTMPSLFSDLNNDFNIYNFGVQGYGPAHGLTFLKNQNLHELVKENDGVMVYYFFHFLIDRVKGSVGYLESTAGLSPKYTLGDSELTGHGSFSQSNKYKIAKICFKSEILTRWMLLLEKIKDKDVDLLAHVFLNIKKEYLKQYPKGEFIIYIPGAYSWHKTSWRSLFLERLNSLRVKYIEGSENLEEGLLFKDHHLTPKAHLLFAKELSDRLN